MFIRFGIFFTSIAISELPDTPRGPKKIQEIADMLSDIPEKEWNVLDHKIILLVVVFGCGGDIFMEISRFWVQYNLKNRLCGLRIFKNSS